MSAPPRYDGAEHDAGSADGVWLTDREPGELLGARRVVVNLEDSEQIVVAEVGSKKDAVAAAEQVIEKIDRAAARGEWAELDDRLIRPEAIVSVDVELVE
jgi:hypothetical protein